MMCVMGYLYCIWYDVFGILYLVMVYVVWHWVVVMRCFALGIWYVVVWGICIVVGIVYCVFGI